MIPVSHYLILSGILFTIGILGVIVKRNAIIVFMSIEIMLNAANLTFVAFSAHLQSLNGQIFVFMVMVVAAAEVVVGLALIIAIFRVKRSPDIDEITLMKW
ncbi:NADH-quinone oxidoreductase subunit NuoK [candidate division KSB1 bacterium]|nr:NADH-quinone oxidoreductase subunit NuoK [candidate division KSB1 bacterium]